MSTSINIPTTIESAKAALGGIGALLTAKQWERAAIIYAFTEPSQGQRTSRNVAGSLSFAAFAKLGITGLESDNTIRVYRNAWLSAIAKGMASEVKPGDVITLPTLPWKDHFGEPTTEVQERTARAYITRNPQVAVDAMKAVPAVAEAVTTAIADDNALVNDVSRKAFAKSIGAKPSTGPSVPANNIPTYDYEKRLADAITVVAEAVNAEKAGTWKADVGSSTQLTLLYLQLKDRAARYAAAQPAIHQEVDAFLQSNRAKE